MNFRKVLNINSRIASGYLITIAIIIVITITSITILSKTKINPNEAQILSLLKDLDTQISQSEKLTNNYIYLASITDKVSLNQLHTQSYPALKLDILLFTTKLNDENKNETLHNFLISFDSLIVIQQQILSILPTNKDSSNSNKINYALALYKSELLPNSNKLIKDVAKFTNTENKYISSTIINNQNNIDFIINLLKSMLITLTILSILFYLLTQILILKPIKELKRIVVALSKGEVLHSENLEKRDSLIYGYKTDEVGEMSIAIDELLVGVKNQIAFAEEIGKENYEIEFNQLSEKDTMGKALIEMRNNLKQVAKEDNRRNWTIEGLAKFGEMLRANNDNIQSLCNEIVSSTVQYLKANQGGLFIINETYQDDIHLELLSCYAFERKKHTSKKILKGEGLIGQVWQEGEYVFITEVPNDYVHITSGLGGTNPTCILIMPLKLHDTILGVLEIASFNILKQFEIDFVQKLSESIASTIYTTKMNERTKRLLQESQQQSEDLKTQEEELRQSMEEMTATQEEMERKENEYVEIIHALQHKIKKITEHPKT